jgi:hypothetical protein
MWRTVLNIFINNSQIQSEIINIRRGIFQGDSLSPLWFCIALNPLSKLLNRTEMGLELKSKNKSIFKLTHLFFMDDLKLYAANRPQLSSLLEVVGFLVVIST